jgi:hypothetical protein
MFDGGGKKGDERIAGKPHADMVSADLVTLFYECGVL